MGEDDNKEPQSEIEKQVETYLNKHLTTFSKTVLDALEHQEKSLNSKLEAKLQENSKNIVDYILAQSDSRTQTIVQASFSEFAKQLQERQLKQAAAAPASGSEVPPGANAPPGPVTTMAGSQGLGIFAGFLNGLGQMLSTATLKDVVEIIKTAKGASGVNTMAADQMIQAFKISKLFTNITVANTDIGAFEKMAHEALDTKVTSSAV